MLAGFLTLSVLCSQITQCLLALENFLDSELDSSLPDETFDRWAAQRRSHLARSYIE